MNPLVNEIISTVIQLVLFALIPFVFFLLRRDKSVTFFNYIGWYRPEKNAVAYALSASILFIISGLGMIFFSQNIKDALFSPPSVTGTLRTMGPTGTSVLILITVAVFKTALAEEILFRGFFAKQLIKRLGFRTGNLVQAILFGAIHLLLFWALTKATVIFLLFSFLFSFVAGWTIGYIMQCRAGGSIIPGWIAHAVGNILSYAVIAFII